MVRAHTRVEKPAVAEGDEVVVAALLGVLLGGGRCFGTDKRGAAVAMSQSPIGQPSAEPPSVRYTPCGGGAR